MLYLEMSVQLYLSMQDKFQEPGHTFLQPSRDCSTWCSISDSGRYIMIRAVGIVYYSSGFGSNCIRYNEIPVGDFYGYNFSIVHPTSSGEIQFRVTRFLPTAVIQIPTFGFLHWESMCILWNPDTLAPPDIWDFVPIKSGSNRQSE